VSVRVADRELAAVEAAAVEVAEEEAVVVAAWGRASAFLPVHSLDHARHPQSQCRMRQMPSRPKPI